VGEGIAVFVLAVVSGIMLGGLTVLARRYVRARRGELALAQHAARQILAESAYWASLAGPVWQSDLERDGVLLPDWARPEAGRDGLAGVNSGAAVMGHDELGRYCPDCGAEPGQPCQAWAQGRPAGYVHAGRW
jgi:hypothetical protein